MDLSKSLLRIVVSHKEEKLNSRDNQEVYKRLVMIIVPYTAVL